MAIYLSDGIMYHHPNVKTYPYHKHEDALIVESRKMDIGLVLEELDF